MSEVAQESDVNVAVGKLQELGHRMRSDRFDFKDTDVVNLENIVIAINELEEERKLMHEKLETETIKCSILRHDLKNLPRKIIDQTMMAVMAARQLNADALKNLQNQLECMNNNIQDLEAKSSNLEKENAVLQPESELLKQKHEEIISQLNYKLAEKATMQIALNESRDKVRQANQNIVDLEAGMIQLKEDLIQEKTEAKNEKKELRKSVTDHQIKTRHQKEQNVIKKKELDVLQEKLIESEGSLDNIRKSLKQCETSKSSLEAEENLLNIKLEQQLNQNEDIHNKRAELISDIEKEQQKFEHEKMQILDKISSFESDITVKMEESAIHGQRMKQLHNDLEEKERLKQKDAATVKELDGKLQSLKQSLARKTEEVGHLHNDNSNLMQESKDLLESHQVVVSQFTKQIEDLKEQLEKERIERMAVQERKDETGRELENLKLAQQQFMKDVTESIQEGKKKHSHLSSEGLQLQKEIREMEKEVLSLRFNLKTAQNKYENMFSTMQNKVDSITEEIFRTKMEIEKAKNVLAERLPVYQDLEKFFSHRTNEYDGMKKSIVAQKLKKAGLEDSIKRGKKEIDEIKAPQTTLRNDLKDHSGQVINQLKHHGTDIKGIEHDIYLAGCQLRIILEENQRFEEACKKLQDDLSDLEIQAQENEKLKMVAQNDLAKEKNEFIKKWKDDNLMQEVVSTRDQATAEAFGSVFIKAEKRETKIDNVTLKLRQELQILSDFLNNIASREPSELAAK